MGNSVTSEQLQSVASSLQQNVSNVLNQTDTTVNNTVSITQNVKINVLQGGVWNCGEGLYIKQDAAANMKYRGSVTNDDTTNIVSSLKSELNNSASQTATIVRGWLSNIGTSSNDSIGMNLISRLDQIISENVTTQNINRILNNTLMAQDNEFVIGGTVSSNVCDISQSIQLTATADTLVNNLLKTAVEDEMIGRLVQQADQTLSKTEKGVDSVVGALAIIMVALLIGFIIFVTVFAKNASNPKFIYAMIVLGLVSIGVYFLLAWIFKWLPFKPSRQYWGCQTSPDGNNTGACVQYSDATQGPYPSEKNCLNSQYCIQFWGCEKDPQGIPTGNCKQFKNALDGPFASQNECIDKVSARKACIPLYGCLTDSNGFNVQPPQCKAWSMDNPAKPSVTFNDKLDCESAGCPQYWYCASRIKNSCQQTSDPASIQRAGLTVYNNQTECTAACR